MLHLQAKLVCDICHKEQTDWVAIAPVDTEVAGFHGLQSKLAVRELPISSGDLERPVTHWHFANYPRSLGEKKLICGSEACVKATRSR